MHVLEAEDPVGAAMASRCRPNTGGVQEDAPRRGLLHGLGNLACHSPGPSVRRMLHYQEGVGVSSRMVHSSDGGEGPPHCQLYGVAIQPAEDA